MSAWLQADVYAFSIVLWEIWTEGESPYRLSWGIRDMERAISGELRPAVPEGCPPEWVSLMQVRTCTGTESVYVGWGGGGAWGGSAGGD